MELIPILSLIILVATLSTFILAVGAYVLYKIRESKQRGTEAKPATVQAELISPVPMMAEQSMSRTATVPAASMERYQTSETYEEPMYTPQKDTAPQMRPTFVGQQERQTFAEASRYQGQRTVDQASKQTAARKFTRYTTAEQFEKPRKEEAKKEEKESLRWR